MADALRNKAIIISNIVHEGARRGYKLFIAGLGAKNIFIDKLSRYPFDKIDIINAKYNGKDLEGTYLALDKYPVVDMENIIQKQGIIAFACILDKVTKKPIGAVVINPLGNQYNVTYTNLKLMMQKYPAINFKFDYNANTDEYIVGLDGSEFPTVEKTAPKSVTYNSINDGVTKEGNKVSQAKLSDMPTLIINEFDDVKGSDILSRANATVVDVDSNMNIIAPYYFVMSRQIPKKPTTAIDTMAVTENEMIYNPNFLASLTVSEATFIFIHEMLHIAMSHGTRFDPLTMNHELWNIACDLYINAIISRDFKVKPHGGETKIDIRDKENNSVVESGYIKVPAWGCFVEDFDMTLDFAKDSPETLYARLIEENKKQQQQNQQQGQQGQQGQQSQQQQGQQNNQQQQGQDKQEQQNQQNGQSNNQNQPPKLGKRDNSQNNQGGESNQPQPSEISDLFDGIRIIRECLAKKDLVHTSDGMGKVQEAIDNMRKKGMLD